MSVKEKTEKFEVSILMAVSEMDIKRKSLFNALRGISIQKTPYNFELCVIDDYSQKDIKGIINDFFKKYPHPNLKRIAVASLKKKGGFTKAPAQAINIVSPESQKMFILASDCVLLKENSIYEICNRVGPKKVVYSEVAEVVLPFDFYLNFDKAAQEVINDWENHLFTKPAMVSRRYPAQSWLFFSGAALKKDLFSIDYDKISCDAVLWQKMMPSGFEAEILTYIPTAHQAHKRSAYPCPRVLQCPYHCSRTRAAKGIRAPTWRSDYPATIVFENEGEVKRQYPHAQLATKSSAPLRVPK